MSTTVSLPVVQKASGFHWTDIQWADIVGNPLRAITTRDCWAGKGNANKAAMIAAAQRKWPGLGIADDDDNRADALWILDLAQQTLGINETTSGPIPGANLGEPED